MHKQSAPVAVVASVLPRAQDRGKPAVVLRPVAEADTLRGEEHSVMDARAVDDAARRLADLRGAAGSELAAGLLALGLAVAASFAWRPLAVPLLVGGMLVTATGAVALVRQRLLVEELAVDRDAQAIPEVRSYALALLRPSSRRQLAGALRSEKWRHQGLAEELEALASELEDGRLALDPACAAACSLLVTDGAGPLVNPARPPEDLRAAILHIRSGFEERMAA
jgi:hypothetical protein